ncbi:RNA-binding S4 domain-containing protein [Colwellia echini]|uniref:RNA-binding S4 domain-containing protein n=1 Tax=Colwellia echini TaxID=1982103 RepID=A0ABY3MYA2_9GAMM|nr:RNA-binding S4 domain-containing protein [Colwellia echini]TYK66190.1 RNA-binding S4 domain-containing protein [Colwellia echini]
MSESYLVVELNRQPVELCKLLKIANLVSGGGEAKIVISEGYVLLNGEVEYQKRKKVYHEDVIEFNGEIVQLVINETLEEYQTQPNEELINSSYTYTEDTDVEEYIEQNPVLAKQKLSKEKAAKAKTVNNKNTKKTSDSDNKTQESKNQPIQPRKRRPISF